MSEEDKTTSKTKVESKQPRKKTSNNKKIQTYTKKSILESLIEYGFHPKGVNDVLTKHHKILPDHIKSFISDQAILSQLHVGEEVNSDWFNSFENWLEYLQKSGGTENCANEMSLLLRLIAETEKHPDICSPKDIDFRQLYLTLSHLVAGYPVAPLEPSTEEYFFDVLKDMLEMSNSAFANEYYEKIYRVLKAKKEAPKVHSDTLQDVINPLQLPFNTPELTKKIE